MTLRTRTRARRCLRWVGTVGALLCALAGQAQPHLPEEQLKAAFVFNFAKYIEWPAEEGSLAQIVACVSGDASAIGDALGAFHGRAVAGRTFHVRRHVQPEELDRCHIAVLSDSSDRGVVAALKHVPAQAVLTVSDADGFVDGGGMIGIVRNGDRLQFDINQAALQRANLKASSQLLKLARNLGARPR
ncbi:MAG: YfiR family protein [Pseudomonadota bacterium]